MKIARSPRAGTKSPVNINIRSEVGIYKKKGCKRKRKKTRFRQEKGMIQEIKKENKLRLRKKERVIS